MSAQGEGELSKFGLLLTPRQIEIMDMVKLGLEDKEIAAKLGIETESVSDQLCHRIYPRLGAKNKAHAVYLCLKRGIIK